MIGKTNSIVVKGGDTPTPATDRYKGLRPSYWPKIKMPDEFEEDQTYELLMEIQWLGDTVDIPLFNNTDGYVDWGDGSGKQKTVETYTYNQSSLSDAFPSFTPLNPKTSYVIIKVYGASFNPRAFPTTTLPDNVKIVEAASKGRGTLYNSQLAFWKDVLFYSFWDISTSSTPTMDKLSLRNCILWPYSRFSYLSYGYRLNILSPLVEFPELIVDDKTQGGFKIYDSQGHFASVSADKLDGFSFYWGFSGSGDSGSSSLQFFPYTTATDWGDINNPFYGYATPPNNIGYGTTPADWGMINLYVDSNLTFNQYQYFFGNSSSYMKISPYIKSVENSTCDWKNLFHDYSKLQVAKLDPSRLAADENSLQDAFYNCSNLRMVIMPENSLKVSINLSAIQTWYSESYTDPETYNSYNSLSEYAWTVIAKALYNFTSASETPSYTPTLTVDTYTWNNYIANLSIDGEYFTSYVSNKGWTIAQA